MYAEFSAIEAQITRAGAGLPDGTSRRERRRAAPVALRRQAGVLNLNFNRASQFSSTGVNSFAYLLRDGCLSNGATGVDVRAHMWSGTALDNPHLIQFSGSARSPGIILAVQAQGEVPGNRDLHQYMQRWRRAWGRRTHRAQEWILGGPSPPSTGARSISDIQPEHQPDASSGASAIPAASGSGSENVPSIIPSRRTGPLDNSESTIAGNMSNLSGSAGTVIGGPLPNSETLYTNLEEWARVMEGRLTQWIP